MKEEIIIQGTTVGYLMREKKIAVLEKAAPQDMIMELICLGYSICIQ